MSATVTAKIVCSGFIASCASEVAPIMQTSRVSSLFKSSIVSCVGSYLGSGLVLGMESVSDSGLGSLSIFFIVGY
jgi:hypothetical protein